MGTTMSQEVKEFLQDEDVDMCMMQIDEIRTSTEEAKRAIRDIFSDGYGCGWGINPLYNDDIVLIQKMEMIESRTKQLEAMIKFSYDVSKRKKTEATCVSPWFFVIAGVMILCRKKM